MRFLDLFAGIGGFRLGMEAAGHKAVGWVEIDKYARKSYEAIHQPEGEWTAHDIASVSDDDIRLLGRERGPIDIICAGFPCQAFSVAGKRGGFSDTRGTLFFEIARFASILRPKYLFLENVKGLLNHNRGNTFETILRTLDELGYDAEWQVLNSADFGVPQHRERVFIIGHLRGQRTRQVFPIRRESTAVDCKLADRPESKILVTKKGDQLVKRDIVTCLDANYAKGLDNHQARTGVMIYQRNRGFNKGGFHDIAPTLTSNSYEQNNRLYDGYRIRKLTPRECWRLQGFPDWAFDRAKAAGVSDSQLYKQAGNSVTVNVIYEIAKRL